MDDNQQDVVDLTWFMACLNLMVKTNVPRFHVPALSHHRVDKLSLQRHLPMVDDDVAS